MYRTIVKINMIENSIKLLKDSPLYNLSMANKELFHSNFLAWFGNTYKIEFKGLINQLLGTGSWPDEKQDYSIVREFKHFDICIKDSSDNPRILIENKVKSVPTKEQLDRYRDEVNDDSCLLILLTMTSHLHDLTGAKGWNIITYKDLSEKLSKVTLPNSYHSQLLKDYCEYVDNLQQIIEAFDAEEDYFSREEQNKIKMDLGIHDICGKRKAQVLYQKLFKKCQDRGMIVVSKYEDLSDDNIYVGWGYTNLPLIDVRFRNQADAIIIEIQGKQYRHAVEYYDPKIGDRITKTDKGYIPSQEGLDYLRKNYSDILSLNNDKTPKNYPFDGIQFGQNKNKGYCKYCNGIPDKNNHGLISCFVYQWIEIPDNTTCDDLVDKIIQDIEYLKKM